jgi:hypothetical protein
MAVFVRLIGGWCCERPGISLPGTSVTIATGTASFPRKVSKIRHLADAPRPRLLIRWHRPSGGGPVDKSEEEFLSFLSHAVARLLGPGPHPVGCRRQERLSRGSRDSTLQGSQSESGRLIGVSMRRHILSRANVVASERRQLSQPKPLRAVFLFALRLSQSKVARCSMGSIGG